MRTVEEIHIRISEDGSRTVSRNIENVGKSANTTERSIGQLKAGIAGVVSGVVLNQLKELADSYTTIQNRLRLTTTSQSNLNSVFNELVDISSRTRSSLDANVELYSRLTLAAKSLGASQREILQFTESVNKAIKISGATASEAEGGLRQLAQGLASGALRGDELNSVMENLPAVADVVAKSLGITRGQLRQLGQQGKITGDIILKAFREAREELNDRFAKTIPTISEGWVVFKNQLLVTVGAMNEVGGGSNLVGQGLALIADTLKEITPELVNFVRALTGSLDAFDELSDAGKVFASVFITIYGAVKAVIQLITTGLTTAFKIAGQSIGAVFAIQDQLLRGDFAGAAETIKNNWVDNFKELSKGIAEAGSDLVGTTTSTVDKLKKVWDDGAREIREVQITAKNIGNTSTTPAKIVNEAELEKERKALERLQSQLRSVLNEIAPIEGAQLELAKATMTLQEATNKGVITTQQQAQYLELLGEHYRDILDPIGAFNRQMQQEAHLLSLGSHEREVEAQVIQASLQLREKGIILSKEETEALRANLTALQSYTELIQAQDRILDSTVGKRREFATQLQAMQNLMKSGDLTPADVTTSQADLLRSIGIDVEGTQTGVQAQLAALQTMYDQIAQMRAANVISEQQAAEAIAQVQNSQRELQLKSTQDFLTGISSLMQSGNKKMFAIGKAAALTQATVSYYQAIMNAYATQPWYVGLAQGIAATAQLGSVISRLKNTKYEAGGYMTGGYTGDGPINQVAGAVHGQEYVFNAAATRRIGVANLDRMQRGQASVASGAAVARAGSALGGGSGVSVEIYNYGSDKEFEVQQMNEERVRIIARDVAKEQVYEHAPKSISGEMNNPNSQVSRSLARNTHTTRKR